jgi:DNA-binding response OmpR family regulator
LESGKRSGPTPRGHPARLVLIVGVGLRVESSVSHTLVREGLRCLWLSSVTRALETARLVRIDAVVLDSAEVDGVAGPTLAQVRQQLRCPIVVVAHDADEIDEIVALELGADAFLVRPLAPRRLRAHLMALMRRAASSAEPGGLASTSTDRSSARSTAAGEVSMAGWALDTLSGSLTGRGRRVDLTVVQRALMQCLANAAGRVVSSSQLTAALPGGAELAANSLHVYIGRLRKRLLDEGVHELRVEAVRGRGFVLRSTSPGPGEVTPMLPAR